MVYATLADIEDRSRRSLTEAEQELCGTLIADAAIIIDCYNEKAEAGIKKMVTCNMVIRAIGDDNSSSIPIGANQSTVSALGYSQTWSMASGGSTGELYLTKLEKKLLGASGGKLGSRSPLEDM